MIDVSTYDPDRPIPVVLTEGLVRNILYGLEEAAAEFRDSGFCVDCDLTAKDSGIPDLPCANHSNDFEKADNWQDAAAALRAITGVDA
ncbi:hypothetical protein [Nonomuraea longicatena]